VYTTCWMASFGAVARSLLGDACGRDVPIPLGKLGEQALGPSTSAGARNDDVITLHSNRETGLMGVPMGGEPVRHWGAVYWIVFLWWRKGAFQMRKRFLESHLAAAMLAFWPVLFAQAAPQPAAAKATPDLSGVWAGEAESGFGYQAKGEEPSMLPWAQQKYRTVRSTPTNQAVKAGNGLDPAQYPFCLPEGFPRIYDNPHPFEIVQVPGRVYMNFEIGNQMRRIYTDGRKHHEGWPAMFMGDSIGRWEGNTLVAETVNLNEIAWLDGVGHPHSNALRVEERIRRLNHDTLEVDFLFDDPKTYTKPWRGKRIFHLRSNSDLMENIYCEGDSGKAYREANRKTVGEKTVPVPGELSK
jgi:hypothetical protein